MENEVLSLADIRKSSIGLVGGKAANLGELFRVKGVSVPDGFVVTTEVFQRLVVDNPALDRLIGRLAHVKIDDRNEIGALTAEIRLMIGQAEIPAAVRDEVTRQLVLAGSAAGFGAGSGAGSGAVYAVRSSATAEDLPTASFAGQQDTYLNVAGIDNILRSIGQCWASLYTDRAVIYRMQNGFDHRKVSIAVIVQKMVFAEVAGTLFTADPITGNRTVSTIDAGFGLGEALVSGQVNPDGYKVARGAIVEKKIVAQPALSDEQILRLDRIGRVIEAHFGYPQDIEWCLVDDRFYIVQSRPITTLYPIPVKADDKNHVYVSVGHQQMMTDAMRPLGISIWQMTAARPMNVAGSRLFVDITDELAAPEKRDMIINVLGKNDPLIRDALLTIVDRGFVGVPGGGAIPGGDKAHGPRNFNTLQDFDPAVVGELIGRRERDLAKLKTEIESKTGNELFEFMLADIEQFKKSLADPQSFGVIMTAMNASGWINEKMQEWLGETNVADTLTLSVSNNVTSEMGLALLDVADVIRPYPEVIGYLEQGGGDPGLDTLPGGPEASRALRDFLDKYGMRCPGEIDITRTRWSENPAALVPLILTNVRNSPYGASRRKFEQGLDAAFKKQQELLERLRQLPGGEQKAGETKRMIDLLRNLTGYREYPKYSIVCRYFVYKQALLRESERLVKESVIREVEDIYYLTFEELREAVRAGRLDYNIVTHRREQYAADERLSPPRVMTSDGEIITGQYRRGDIPAHALKGLAVSSGVIEGRARVVLRMEDAVLEEGDILVTRFTDPSWTPLFVSVKGLVTEVGGLMTHGAVIAREYGLPAVVGVEGATALIRDGQKIRVNGTEGYIEVLT